VAMAMRSAGLPKRGQRTATHMKSKK
jgi:hypothetical protein